MGARCSRWAPVELRTVWLLPVGWCLLRRLPFLRSVLILSPAGRGLPARWSCSGLGARRSQRGLGGSRAGRSLWGCQHFVWLGGLDDRAPSQPNNTHLLRVPSKSNNTPSAPPKHVKQHALCASTRSPAALCGGLRLRCGHRAGARHAGAPSCPIRMIACPPARPPTCLPARPPARPPACPPVHPPACYLECVQHCCLSWRQLSTLPAVAPAERLHACTACPCGMRSNARPACLPCVPAAGPADVDGAGSQEGGAGVEGAARSACTAGAASGWPAAWRTCRCLARQWCAF